MLKFNETALSVRCLRGTLIVLSLLMVMGCWPGSGKSSVKKDYITFNILPDSLINDERLVYIVFRKVNKMEFLIDNYDGIADMVFAKQPNESILVWQMLLPKQKKKIKVIKPEQSDIGVYVLFANPGENWKLILEAPLKKEYQIKVKKNELEEVPERSFW